MVNYSNFFSKMDVCGDFKEAKALAREMEEPYVTPCKSDSWLGVFGKIPCRLREFTCFVSNSYKKSWKLRFITLFIIILFCMNCYLIHTGQVTANNMDGGVGLNSLYFTTTQLSSVGFGDWTPSSNLAKWSVSIANILVMVIAYSVVEEFGYVTVARSNQTAEIEKNVKRDLGPVAVGMTPEVREVIKENIIQKMSLESPQRSLGQIVNANKSIDSIGDKVINFGDRLKKRVEAKKLSSIGVAPSLPPAFSSIADNSPTIPENVDM
jgi:hypothetical protein